MLGEGGHINDEYKRMKNIKGNMNKVTHLKDRINKLKLPEEKKNKLIENLTKSKNLKELNKVGCCLYFLEKI